MRSVAFYISLIILFFTIVSCKEKKAEVNRIPARSVNMPVQAEGFIVKTRPLSENIEVPGTIMPYETTVIRPEISGRIVEMNIPEGRIVQKGALLVKLFDGDLQAQLKKLEVQLSIANKTVERQKALLEISGISQQEYDLSQLQSNNLEADIELVKVNISKTRIVAPYTGKIGLRNVSAGAYVTPADILTTISQVKELKLEFTVPEKYSGIMTRGRTVDFTVDGINKKFSAGIMAAESAIEADTRSLRIRAIIKGNNPDLVAGGFAKVSLQLGYAEQPLVVPTQAVIPQARNKQVIVYRNGKPEFSIVTTGIRDSSYVQIINGLHVGDTVITTALLAIRPESRITLTKVK